MKAVIYIAYLDDEADASGLLEQLLDSQDDWCPSGDLTGDAECLCEGSVGHIVDVGDDKYVDWEVKDADD